MGVIGQSAGNGHSLLLPAGQRGDTPLFKPFQVYQLQHFRHRLAHLTAALLLQFRAKGDVLIHI